MTSIRVALLVMLVAQTSPLAQAMSVLHVPTNYSTIQLAIDAAQADDIIVVHGGTYAPIVIDKPLTLVGEPLAFIVAPDYGLSDPAIAPPLITLAGPGDGDVTLIRMNVSGLVNGDAIWRAGAAIEGTGFESLRVVWSTIQGTDITSGGDGGSTGGPGIALGGIPRLYVSNSLVSGGDSNGLGSGIWNPDGAFGIANTTGTVVLLSSDIYGGSVHDAWSLFPSPLACDAIEGGVGGVAIYAKHLFLADSTLTPGAGVTLIDAYDPTSTCTQPSGQTIVAIETVVLSELGGFEGPGLLELGQVWSMWLGSPYTSYLLLVGSDCEPVELGSHGWLCVAPVTMVIMPVTTGFTAGIWGVVPSDPALAGLTITMQTYDGRALSRPAMTAIVP